MSHWCHTMVDGAEYWISCKRPAFLSSFSRLQVIRNSAQSAIVWHQCDIWMLSLVERLLEYQNIHHTIARQVHAREWKYIIDGQDFRFCILIKFNLKSLYSLILSRMLDVSGRLLIITRQIKQNFWPSKLWWVRLSSPCRFWQALVDQGFRFVTFWNLIVFVDKNLNTTWRKQGAALWLQSSNFVQNLSGLFWVRTIEIRFNMSIKVVYW